MRRSVYWIGMGIFAIPAVIGCFIGCAVLTASSLLLIVVALLAGALMILSLLPLIVWSAIMDEQDWMRVRQALRHRKGQETLN